MPLPRTNRSLVDGFRAGKPEALAAVYWEYVRKVERLLSAGFVSRGGSFQVMAVCPQADDLGDLA